MKKSEIDVVVFNGVRGLAFVKCPICKTDMVVRDDVWSKCRHARDRNHVKKKKVYILKKDFRRKEGFSKVIETHVNDYRKQTLKELEV